jgi:hypothetical protein
VILQADKAIAELRTIGLCAGDFTAAAKKNLFDVAIYMNQRSDSFACAVGDYLR